MTATAKDNTPAAYINFHLFISFLPDPVGAVSVKAFYSYPLRFDKGAAASGRHVVNFTTLRTYTQIYYIISRISATGKWSSIGHRAFTS
jgi:hypothetical protein